MISSIVPVLPLSRLVQLLNDRLFRSNHREDIQLGDPPDVVDGEDVQRIGHRQVEAIFQAGDGDDLVSCAPLRAEGDRPVPGSIPIRLRLIGGVLSTRPMETAMSCSLT